MSIAINKSTNAPAWWVRPSRHSSAGECLLANRCNVWRILELRFTFKEGACSRLTDIAVSLGITSPIYRTCLYMDKHSEQKLMVCLSSW